MYTLFWIINVRAIIFVQIMKFFVVYIYTFKIVLLKVESKVEYYQTVTMKISVDLCKSLINCGIFKV